MDVPRADKRISPQRVQSKAETAEKPAGTFASLSASETPAPHTEHFGEDY